MLEVFFFNVCVLQNSLTKTRKQNLEEALNHRALHHDTGHCCWVAHMEKEQFDFETYDSLLVSVED